MAPRPISPPAKDIRKISYDSRDYLPKIYATQILDVNEYSISSELLLPIHSYQPKQRIEPYPDFGDLHFYLLPESGAPSMVHIMNVVIQTSAMVLFI
jgi:hypothetical protein